MGFNVEARPFAVAAAMLAAIAPAAAQDLSEAERETIGSLVQSFQRCDAQ